MEIPYRSRIALVTGASRGIGAAFVRELATRGIGGLVLVARAQDELEELAKELRIKYAMPPDAPIVVLPADLSHPDAPEKIKAETDRLGMPIGLLINNAGFGSHGFFHTLTPEKERDMVQVNIAALTALTRLYLPEMVERGSGAILNVSSTAAFQPVPYMATYAATKAFVQSFSEALWAEMQECGSPVRILALCPGGTTTHFGDGLTRGGFENLPHDTPENVARVGIDALNGDHPHAVVGALNQWVVQIPRFLPRKNSARMTARLFRPVRNAEASRSNLEPGKALALAAVATGIAALTVALASRRRN
ncbi:MAG: SDR family oxidoreductase [Capsulimonadales bacterium]|nr:SDR family oxidoreductase [Capsulimonadales bacterium]